MKHNTQQKVDKALLVIREEIDRLYGERCTKFNKDCFCCKAHRLLDRVEKAIDFSDLLGEDNE